MTKEEACDYLNSVEGNILLTTGSKELADWDGQLISAPGGTKRIKKALKDIEDDYDFVIMDTSPSLGGAMRNALFAADGIVIPVQAKKFALDGLSDFLDTVFELKGDGNEDLQILGILLTMLDQRNKQDREVLLELARDEQDEFIPLSQTILVVVELHGNNV